MDGTQVAVNGLDEVLADLYAQDRQANKETADEIISRLEGNKNYVPSSDVVRREYRHLLLTAYREYISERGDNGPAETQGRG